MKKYRKQLLFLLGVAWVMPVLLSAQGLCEPIYSVHKHTRTYAPMLETSSNLYNAIIIAGQPIIAENSTNYSQYSMSAGFYADYLTEPKAPLLRASDGDFQDMVLLDWDIEGDFSGPPVTSDEVVVYRNGYILTTLPATQTQYQDFNVFPGEYYTYGVTVTNTMGESQTDDNVGFLNPNGIITGHIETPSGTPMVDTKVILTPNLGRSALFDGDGYVYWFDSDINTNRQFTGMENDYTIELWFRSIVQNQQSLFGAVDSNSTNNRVLIELTDGGQVNWVHNGVSMKTVNSYTNDFEWHHLAVVKEASDMTMYIDGALVGEGSGATDINAKLEMTLGKHGPRDPRHFYTGRMDDFRIWSYARRWENLLNVMDITLSGEEDGLSAYFKFDEVEGDVIFDLTANDRDGKTCRVDRDENIAPVFQGALTNLQGDYAIKGIYYAGGTTFTVTPSLASPIGRSLQLDGVDDYVSFGGQRIDLTGDYTMEGWFKTSSNGDHTIFSAVDPITGENHLNVKASGGTLSATYLDVDLFGISVVDDNLWHHWAVTYEGGNLTLYVDAEVDAESFVESSYDSESNISFGKSSLDTDYYFGRLDEFRQWDYARNYDQIGGTMNQFLEGDEYGLVEYWKMNDGIGILTTNTVGTSAGTLEGGIEWSMDIPLNEVFDHWYEPESRQATLNQSSTSIDQVSFEDKSLIPVSGYVRYENTACFNGGVEILVDGTSLIPPLYTSDDGKFTVDIEPGSIGKILTPNYYNVFSGETHEFLPPLIELPMMVQPITGLYFNDRTSRVGSGTVAGGTCAHPITPSQGNIEVTFRPVDGCVEETIIVDEYGQYESSALPPLIYNLSVDHPNPSIDEFFIADSMSMEHSNRFRDFVYRAPVEAEFGQMREIDGATHAVKAVVQENECGEYPYILQAGKYYQIDYDVFERYGENTCRVDNFDIAIFDNISDTSYTGTVAGEYAGQSVPLTFSGKTPNMVSGGDHPYQKNISIVVAGPGGGSSTTEIWALLEGTKKIPGANFQTQSNSWPWMVLRTPPGDGSFTYFSAGGTVCNSSSYSVDMGVGGSVEAVGSFGTNQSIIVGTPGGGTITDVGVTFDVGSSLSGSATETSATETENCITTSETYTAYGDGLLTGNDATVYVGGGKSFDMGLARILNMEECSVEIDTTVSMSQSGVHSTFILSRFYIENVMMPNAMMTWQLEGDSTSLDTYNYWESVIDWDSNLMETAFSSPDFAIGEDGGVGDTYIAYDAGATFEYSYINETTTSSTSEFVAEFEQSTWVTLGGEVAGIGAEGTVTGTISGSTSNTNSSGNTSSIEIGYTLDDDDPGDGFLLQVLADTWTGMPVFKTVGGQSMCPWEYGTMKRHLAEMEVAVPLLVDVPPDEPAVFEINLINASATGEANYYELMSENASLNGAEITVNGQWLGGAGQWFWLEPGVNTPIIVEVNRGAIGYEFDDIYLELHAPCEGDIAADLGANTLNAGSILISAHFQEPCSESNIANIEDGWLIDGSHGSDSLWVTIDGYDPEDENLISVDLQYRSGSGDWFTAASVLAEDLVDDYVLMPFNVSPNIVIDGEYELRSQAVCGGGKYPGTSASVTGTIDRSAPAVFGLPEPAGGILGPDDFIGASFDENVQCGEINPGAGDIQLWNTVNGMAVDFDFTCGFNTVTVEPAPANVWLENQTFRAEIHNLQDIYGNTRDEAVVWEFYVNRNPIEWSGTNIDNVVIWVDDEYSTQRQLVNNGGSNRSYEMIAGREGAIPSGDAISLPNWLEVAPMTGTITPGSAQDISIGLVEGLDFGHYQTTLYAAGTMGDEPMIVDIRKLCYEPEWSLNPADYQYTMSITATLSTEGELSDDGYDIIGVFVGDELRGIARVDYIQAFEDLAGTHPYEVFLTIYSNETSGEDLSFRVWDASACTELGWIEESFSFESNASHGTPTNPVTITATSQVITSLDYPAGFTWFSLNLENIDMSLNNIMSNMNPAGGDQIKNQTSFAQYVEGYGWVGPLSEFSNKSMYLISLANSDEMEMVGYPVNVELDTINVVTGWNWVGFQPQYSMTVDDALESLNSATGDIVKSQFGFAQYVEGFGWIGSLNYMSPKQGYMLKSLWAGDLNYPFELSNRDSEMQDEIYQAPLAENAPSWNVNVNQYEHSMTMTATGLVNGLSLSNETDMIGAFTLVETDNGMVEECRGVTQPIYIEALDQYSAFLMVYSNTPEEDIYFKLFEANQDIIWSVYEGATFASNSNVGDVLSPFNLNAQPPVGDVTFDGVLNVIDVLQTVNYILDILTPSIIEFAVADMNMDESINVADIVEMVSIILDVPMIKAEADIVVDIKVQGNQVFISSENNIAGIQFDLPDVTTIDSRHEYFTNYINGSLKTVILNMDGHGIHDGLLFTTEHIQSITNIIIVDRSGAELAYEVRFVPMNYKLAQNYPNPFNPETTINFDLPDNAKVSIAIFDLQGRLIIELVNGQLEAGYHSIKWNAQDISGVPLSNGVYFYRMTTPEYNSVKKMVLLK